MKRIAAALFVMGVLVQGAAAFVPRDESDVRFALSLPAPASQAAAERTAEAFVRQQLDYPTNAVLTFRPAVRAYLKPLPSMKQTASIWMCGTIRLGSVAETGTWIVAFDWMHPALIHDGGSGFGRSSRFNRRWCDEIYRDGLRVFAADGVTVLGRSP